MLLLKIKNFILALLAIFIIFSPINIKANNSYNYDYEYEYNIDNGFSTHIKHLGTETQIIISKKIDGYPVKSFIETFADNNIIKSVMVTSTVTNIGDRTFYKYTKLDELQFLPSLDSIGNYAFYDSGLKTIEYGDIEINSDIMSLLNKIIYTHSNILACLAKSDVFRQIIKIKSHQIKALFILLYAITFIVFIFLCILLILNLINILSGNKKKKYLKYLKQYENYIITDSNIIKAFPHKNNLKKLLLLLLSVIVAFIWLYLLVLCWLFLKVRFNYLNYTLKYIIYVIFAIILTAILIILIVKIIIKIKSHQNIRVKKSKRKNQDD